MALFSSKNAVEEAIPQSRVSAFADMEIASFLKETPITVADAGKIDWDVSYEGERVYAEGAITIPVRLIFKAGNLKNDMVSDDLVFIDVELAGESQLGIRFEKPKVEAFDPLASVDVAGAIAQAKKEHEL